MRTWPAIDATIASGVSRMEGAGESRPELFQAALTDFDVAAIDESVSDRWRIFFHAPVERDRALTALCHDFADLALTPVDVPDEDWAARSQANLRAIRIGGLVVAPPWDVPEGRVIVIQPSMGFGTGHHATTRLCLAALQDLDLRDKTVLDVGTGSGVLAIAARLLGAARVLGIDDDPDAIESARENVGLNPGAEVDLRVADLKTLVSTPVHVVVANLTGGLLMQTAPALRQLVRSDGRLILSGFLHTEEAGVLAAFGGLAVVDRRQEDEWMCVTLQREGVFA